MVTSRATATTAELARKYAKVCGHGGGVTSWCVETAAASGICRATIAAVRLVYRRLARARVPMLRKAVSRSGDTERADCSVVRVLRGSWRWCWRLFAVDDDEAPSGRWFCSRDACGGGGLRERGRRWPQVHMYVARPHPRHWGKEACGVRVCLAAGGASGGEVGA
eukprot:CAMPEP_0180402756 /NCGR_PEP_ID=MMETSP0989-20121125/39045_1 /TAXON_ID=697907 /ORGANISM="non described non described, Strain CCMP2293" /LENGTH=164 /DNA_ID=CAMNT_0022405913 /DNA_START=245 /DNA_END=739 /DNA_ORIENTATION=-